MNKKLLTIFMILLIPTIFALTYYGLVSRTVTIDPSVTFTGDNAADIGISGGESVYSEALDVVSQTSVIVPLKITTTANPDDCTVTNTNNYLLDNTGGVCGGGSTTCEKRIYIQAKDVNVDTVSDINTIEWEASVTAGYLPHIDVLIDTDDDGVADDALVFEYDKVDDGCGDGAPYPTGELNTFGDKGSIDDSSYAWLNSGQPGNCQGDPGYTVDTLLNWKLLNYKVIAFELEVDNWILESNSNVKNVKINGNNVEVSLKSEDSLNFKVQTDFGLLCEGDYEVSIEVTADESRR